MSKVNNMSKMSLNSIGSGSCAPRNVVWAISYFYSARHREVYARDPAASGSSGSVRGGLGRSASENGRSAIGGGGFVEVYF
jgi:hypothetical protein